MKKFLAVSILLLTDQAASAKCAPDVFVFSGIVTGSSGAPVGGAVVGIAWAEKEGASGPQTTTTNAAGEYEITVAFDTYSGKGTAFEDSCDQNLTSVSLSARKGELQAPFQRVRIGGQRHVSLPKTVLLQPSRAPKVKLIPPSG